MPMKTSDAKFMSSATPRQYESWGKT